jgi:hypothetical protein
MKAWVLPVVLICALATFVCGAVLMPASELMPATVTPGPWTDGLSPVRSYDAMQAFKGIGNSLSSTLFNMPNVDDAMTKPMHTNIPGDVRSYVAYAIFLSLAMIFAAVAINCIGRWDSEEKTIIPYKK